MIFPCLPASHFNFPRHPCEGRKLAPKKMLKMQVALDELLKTKGQKKVLWMSS